MLNIIVNIVRPIPFIMLVATLGQNLVSIDPGVIEAVHAAGAKPFRIITTVLIPEALGPLILGYTFVMIGIVDMQFVQFFGNWLARRVMRY